MNTYKYIALAALVLGFTACSQDDDFAPQQTDIVQIASANIATEVQTRVNTLADGKTFEDTDRILLVNNSRTTKNSGTYTYNSSTWSLTEGMVLYASSGTNDFTAYYPAVAEADYTLPADQSTTDSIKYADRMIADPTGVDKSAAVALSFVRQNAMVTITPSFNTEFNGKQVSDIVDFKIDGITPLTLTDENEEPYAYKAIIAPSTETETGFTVTLTVGGQTLTAITSNLIEAGKQYSFNLTVGKELLSLKEVSVNVWTDKTFSDVDADEWQGYEYDKTTGTYIVYDVDVDGLTSIFTRGGNMKLANDITVNNQNYFNIYSDVTLDLNGHTITNGSFYVANGASLTIKGEGGLTTPNYDVLTTDSGSTVNIENGTINGSVCVYGGNLNISGGTITGYFNVYGGNITITGGTFDFDPSDYIGEGYVATGNEDGTWTVTVQSNN